MSEYVGIGLSRYRHWSTWKHWVFWIKYVIDVTIALFGNWQTVVMAWK